MNYYTALAQGFLALLVLSVSLLFLYLRHNSNYWKNRNVPYDKPSLLFGNFSFLMRKSVWAYFRELRQRFPKNDYVGIHVGWQPTLVVQTPELARRILTKDFEYFQNRNTTSSYETDPLGALNIFTLKNPVWSQIRHDLSPLFTSLRLKQVTELMNINATELVHKIKRDYIDKHEPCNLKELFSMYTSDTVGSTVFGIKVSALNDPSSPLWYITKHMVKFDFKRGLEFIVTFYLPALASLLRLQLFSKGATDHIKKLFWTVADQRIKTGAGADSNDLVNHLLKLKEKMKLPASDAKMADDYMLAQAAVFILGSIETSSTTLSFCFHELAHHPKVQEKLYDEIREVMKTKGKDVLDYDDLLEVKYLTACILETLRKYPPVQNLDRMCNKRYKLNDEVTVEKGIPVFVNVVALHYDEEVYPNPEKWDPERMYDVAESDNKHFSFLPFGDGPRFCIGKRYGVMQVRAAIAQVLANYKIDPDSSVPKELLSDPYSAFLSPLGGGRVVFTPRQ